MRVWPSDASASRGVLCLAEKKQHRGPITEISVCRVRVQCVNVAEATQINTHLCVEEVRKQQQGRREKANDTALVELDPVPNTFVGCAFLPRPSAQLFPLADQIRKCHRTKVRKAGLQK